jgi:hypothetical protein
LYCLCPEVTNRLKDRLTALTLQVQAALTLPLLSKESTPLKSNGLR